MRREYEDSNISLKRIQVLNDAGFICEMSYDWLERYEELLQYVAEHGNALVPYRYGYFPGEDGEHRSSGTWVIRQRFLYNAGNLSEERVDMLNDIRFEWDHMEAQWLEQYEELLQYVNEHGNSSVPSRYELNPSLGNWVDK
jgi:hypothetical protein